jgi:LDH2 family malate/lactate/ureidoglycolate dehydrogenase
MPVLTLAEAEGVALMFANTPAAIAPAGGTEGVFGTNPIAFACPLPSRAPIVIDLSLSKVARGNILAAQQKGERIPEGWALDAAGRPTSDPASALAGTMVPLGDRRRMPPPCKAGQSHMAVLVRNDGTAGSTLPPVGGEGRCLAQRGGGAGGLREL